MTSGDARQLPSEWRIYLQQLPGLWPGKAVPVYEVHNIEPGDLHDWSDEDLTILVEEGRRQISRQSEDLERVRGRAQFLFITTLGLLSLLLAAVGDIASVDSPWAFLIWSFGVLTVAFSLLGAVAVVVANKEVGIIDTARLSRQHNPILPELAAAYARVVRKGENTNATQITVYRDAVLLVLVGATLSGMAWFVAVT